MFGFAWPVTTLKPNPRIIGCESCVFLLAIGFNHIVSTLTDHFYQQMYVNLLNFGTGTDLFLSIQARKVEEETQQKT